MLRREKTSSEEATREFGSLAAKRLRRGLVGEWVLEMCHIQVLGRPDWRESSMVVLFSM